MELSYVYHDFKILYKHDEYYSSSSCFDGIQNDRHMLKFYLSESCKSLDNSQLYRFYHKSI